MRQPQVHFEFHRSCTVAIALGEHLEIELDEAKKETVVHLIPIGLAVMLERAETSYGEVVELDESDDDDDDDDDDDNNDDVNKLYAPSELIQMSISTLREIGDIYNVKSSKKDELAERITASQKYTEGYLLKIDKEDVGAIATALELEGQANPIAAILAIQEDSE